DARAMSDTPMLTLADDTIDYAADRRAVRMRPNGAADGAAPAGGVPVQSGDRDRGLESVHVVQHRKGAEVIAQPVARRADRDRGDLALPARHGLPVVSSAGR